MTDINNFPIMELFDSGKWEEFCHWAKQPDHQTQAMALFQNACKTKNEVLCRLLFACELPFDYSSQSISSFMQSRRLLLCRPL